MLRHFIKSTVSTVAHAETSRRNFILGALAASGGMILGFRVEASTLSLDGTLDNAHTDYRAFTPYLLIGTDGKVTVLSSQFEMGQGSYNGIATLVCEELDADWNSVEVQGAAGNLAAYGNMAWGGAIQGTGGSTSMVSSWERYRKAGAAARAMLTAAAASDWGVPPSEIMIESGLLSHSSGKSGSFGHFVAKAAQLDVPANPRVKDPSEWKLIGKADLKRFDSARKANGTERYTIDVSLPDMLTAVMIHPPLFGSKVKTFDASEARAISGVVDVVETPRGIAIVGQHMWAAMKGRDAVKVEWDQSGAETRGSSEIFTMYRDIGMQKPAALARNDGNADGAFENATTVLEAVYEFPYLAHCPIEPQNAVARMNGDGILEVWGGHQMPSVYQDIAAQVAGISPDKVRLHVMKTGGSFGRRAVGDADVIVEAVSIAKALQFRAPVKVQWTREDEMRAGRYRPAYLHSMKAALDGEGKLVAWSDHIVGQSVMSGTPFAGAIQNGVDPTSVEGMSDLPYAIPNISVGLTTTELGIPVLWWRSVGTSHNAFAAETFMDEVAERAGRDPVEFRLSMLKPDSRHAVVLKLAAEKAAWSDPTSEGRFRGVSVAESFGSVVAQVAEIAVDDKGGFKVHRVVAAVDCGVAINPDQIRAQIEGGIGFGLGAITAEEVTLTAGQVDQINYDTYTPLRIDAMPRIEVHIVSSPNPPSGIGEPGVPPIGPAVANALSRALGKRVRVLPLAKGLKA